MPNLEEHCKHSLKNCGVEGRDIHIWMDEPCRRFAGSHRQYRHDKDNIDLVKKLFGNKYGNIGEKIAECVATDHVLLDHDETVKKIREKNAGKLLEKNHHEAEEYEKLRKEQRRKQRLSKVKTSNLRNFIQIKYAGREESGPFNGAVAALLDWEKYCLSRENPNSKIEANDIGKYILLLKDRLGADADKQQTIATYLHYLIAYFKYDNQETLAIAANNEKKVFVKLSKEAGKNSKRIPYQDVIELYKNADCRGRVLMRLLLLETRIPIDSLCKIAFVQTSEGYQFNVDGQIVYDIDKETTKLAEQLMKDNSLVGEKTLLGIRERRIQQTMEIYSRKANLPYDIASRDLRRFGKNQHPDNVKEWLSIATKQPP